MKKNILAIALLMALLALPALVQAKSPMSNAKVTLTCSNGATFSATTDADGKFSIRKDDDCDDFTITVSSEGTTLSNSRWSWGASQSGSMSNKREAGSGLATGRRQHQPIRVSTSLCPNGECTSSSSVCTIDLTVTGPQIQGMAINEKGLPGEKKPKKTNSNK